MKRTLVTPLFLILLSGMAFAADDTPPGANTDSPSGFAGAKSLDAACGKDAKKNPFLNKVPPRKPDNVSSLPDDQKIADSDVPTFQYNACAKVRSYGPERASAGNCDTTLASILKIYRDDKDSIDELRKQACDDAKVKVAGCVSGQADAQKCASDIYKSVGDQFTKLSEKLHTKAEFLFQHQGVHLKFANALLKPDASGHATIDANLRPSGQRYIMAGTAGSIPKQRTDREPMVCGNTMGSDTSFCGHAVAAAEAKYYGDTFEEASKITGDVGRAFVQRAQTAKTRGDQAGNPKGGGGGDNSTVTGNDKKGGLLGGVGLDDMIKLATLGMTGAGLYCTITKNCSQNSGQQQAPTDPGAGGATSPTPTSGNSGPEKTSLGDTKSGTGTSQTGDPTKTAPAVDTSFHSPGYSGSSSDPSLARFNGSLDSRAPASAAPSMGSASGGGGSFGGIGGGSLGGADKGYNPLEAPRVADSGGSGMGLGGGGLASAGSSGFNLGDSHTSTPADAALKNILNGDTPPASGDFSLPGLDAGGAPGAQAGASGPEDPESLFMRVRSTHVRCLQRGCVAQGVGENI
ncbi:MAG: hypothetical protein ACXWRT_18940 [Bdellovibrionota bacterium]